MEPQQGSKHKKTGKVKRSEAQVDAFQRLGSAPSFEGVPARALDDSVMQKNQRRAPTPAMTASEGGEISSLPWPMEEKQLGGRTHKVLAATSQDTLSDTKRVFPLIEMEFSRLRAWSQTKEISIQHAREMCPTGAVYAQDEDFQTLLLPHEDEAGRGKKFGLKKFITEVLARHNGARASTLARYQRYEGSRQKKRSRSGDHTD